ncbi:hypothetical protein [Schumannella sp. 10F1B-5-1]|uniref:hypothetical protein n=1 Tax=Schumannella sp. 10F1B-5-1 TaxID=2590780 RepID=UPI001130AA37|nr:hypothetical protein [Schumannella sp. 10F1B-5-1]TPW78335.1 hypothetical protein FJ658_00565 [Schumannella sp. 10F1B-5-1]
MTDESDLERLADAAQGVAAGGTIGPSGTATAASIVPPDANPPDVSSAGAPDEPIDPLGPGELPDSPDEPPEPQTDPEQSATGPSA